MAKVVPTANNGSSEFVKLRREGGETWLIFQKLKYLWDDDKKWFKAIDFSVNQSMDYYLDWKGHETEEALAEAERHYGNNMYKLTLKPITIMI